MKRPREIDRFYLCIGALLLIVWSILLPLLFL